MKVKQHLVNVTLSAAVTARLLGIPLDVVLILKKPFQRTLTEHARNVTQQQFAVHLRV